MHASSRAIWLADNFEAASLPTTTPEERKRLLSFVVCGGGPTGVETAAEIYDLCQEDLFNYVSSFSSHSHAASLQSAVVPQNLQRGSVNTCHPEP